MNNYNDIYDRIPDDFFNNDSVFDQFGTFGIIIAIIFALAFAGVTVAVIIIIAKAVKKAKEKADNPDRNNIKVEINIGSNDGNNGIKVMVKCPYCDSLVKKGTVTCPNCGGKVK